MKLLMFREGNERRLGVARSGAPDEIVDVTEATDGSGSASLPIDVLGVIDGGEEALNRLGELASSGSGEGVRRLADLALLPPFDPPRGNVLAIGRNYQKHAEEGARALNIEVGPPTIFTKAITTITGPHSDIPINAAVSTNIDWEVELGVVIGRPGSNIKRANALDHVFGYTVANDVTARDAQRAEPQWTRAKGFDTSCPIGPWIVPGLDVSDLAVRSRVNGQPRQDGRTSQLIFDVAYLVSYISEVFTLLPGDVILTGTPAGVGPIVDRDIVEVEVEDIGVLRNPVLRR